MVTTKLSAFFTLPIKDKLRFCESWLSLAVADLCIRFVPFKMWKRCLATHPAESNSAIQLDDIRHVIAISERAGRHHYHKVNCLRRCLAQKWLLQRRNIYPEIKIGVISKQGEFEAHAWLVVGDTCINDTADNITRYTTLKGLSNTAIFNALR